MAASTYRSLNLPQREQTYGRRYVWQLPVRLAHWLNALCLVALFLSGLYIAQPQLAPNGEPYNHFVMGRVRQIHFAAGYILLFGFFVRMYWFWAGNNYSRSGFPFVWKRAWWADLFAQAWQYLKLERGHVHLGHNALAGVAYTTFVIVGGWLQIITGFALYSQSHPGRALDRLIGWVVPLLGGDFPVRMIHHTCAWSFVVFIIVHLYIVMFDSHHFNNGLISSIISGYKYYEEGDLDHDTWLS